MCFSFFVKMFVPTDSLSGSVLCIFDSRFFRLGCCLMCAEKWFFAFVIGVGFTGAVGFASTGACFLVVSHVVVVLFSGSDCSIYS